MCFLIWLCSQAELAAAFIKRSHKLIEILDGGVTNMLKLFEDEFHTHSGISR